MQSEILLRKLELYCFRSYSHLCFRPSFRNLIVGDNGQGKTNLLEALSLLFTGHSFRASLPEVFVQKDKPFASFSAEIFREDKKSEIKLTLESSGRKKLWMNDKKVSFSFLAQQTPLVVFSPESLSLLKGSAVERRMWLDYWLDIRGEAVFSKEFKKILLQKNQLLRQIKTGLVSKKKTFIEGLNEIFVEKSLLLVEARKTALKDLSFFFKKSVDLIFNNFKKEKENKRLEIDLLYFMKGAFTEDKDFEKKKEFFRKESLKRLSVEMEAGLSLYGAHRDDFKVFFQGKDSRYFCSQGQQRALLFALKIAQILWCFEIQKNRGLLLLLDDVFSEIDKHLTFNLLQFLNEIPSQIILTSTKVPSFLDKKKFQISYLSEGRLRKEKESGRKNTLHTPF